MENNKNNKSILEEAVVELKSIMEAADKSAKDRIAKELPEKFEALLKEEIKKNKKESVKESVKDNVKEPVIEGKKDTDKNKESLNEMNEIDLRELSIEDVEEAYNMANENDEFEIDQNLNLESIGDELDSMANDVDDLDNEEIHDEKPEIDAEISGEDEEESFDEKIKELYEILGDMVEKMNGEMPEMGEEMPEMGIETPDEIGEMHEKVPRGATAPANTGHNTTPSGINEALEPEMVGALWGLVISFIGAPLAAFIQHRINQKNPELGKIIGNVGKSANSSSSIGSNSPGTTTEGVEDEAIIDEVNDTDGDKELDEIHGQSFSSGKVNAGRLPGDGADYRDRAGHSRNRQQWSNESVVKKFGTLKENFEKKINGLIGENKKMTKKLIESKKVDAKYVSNQKQLQEALVKYRNLLQEMAVFNTNLASVNNILMNESLALTADDKKNILNKFKDVKSITESEKTYANVLNEMKTAKKTLDESVEEKVNNSIDPSAQKTEKIVEQTAFKNDHVDKIKKLMEYVDNHGNKKILS